MILLSGAWAIHRTMHFVMNSFQLDWQIALPAALFVEIIVLSTAALVFIQFRNVFIAELRDQDATIVMVGAWGGLILLGIALATLIGIAWADAMLITQATFPALIMSMIQIVQSGTIMIFISSALFEERHVLREQYKDLAEQLRQRQARERQECCQYCGYRCGSKNRVRHERSCSKNPTLTNVTNQP